MTAFIPTDYQQAVSAPSASSEDARYPNGQLFIHLAETGHHVTGARVTGGSEMYLAHKAKWRGGLNKEQSRAVILAADLRRSIFLGGKAGTGKSRVVKLLYKLLRHTYGTSAVHVVAPTKAAAEQVGCGATTFQSFFGTGLAEEFSPAVLDSVMGNASVRATLSMLRAIIFDEISMVSQEALDMLDRILRAARKDERSFGGVQMVFVGDPLQLMPIKGHWFFRSEAFMQLVPMPHRVFLTQSYRVGEAFAQFQEFLDRVRYGDATDADVEYANNVLGGLYDSAEASGDAGKRLFSTRKEVDECNRRYLQTLHTALAEFVADDSRVTPSQRGRPFRVPDKVPLKIGCVAIVTKNISSLNLSNGQEVKVAAISRADGKPVSADVRTTDGRTVTVTYADFDEPGGSVRRQIPLMCARGLSIHRIQGCQYKVLLVVLGNSFAEAQAYVALTRATDPRYIRVRGATLENLRKVNKEAVAWERKHLEFQRTGKLPADEQRGLTFSLALAMLGVVAAQATHMIVAARDPVYRGFHIPAVAAGVPGLAAVSGSPGSSGSSVVGAGAGGSAEAAGTGDSGEAAGAGDSGVSASPAPGLVGSKRARGMVDAAAGQRDGGGGSRAPGGKRARRSSDFQSDVLTRLAQDAVEMDGSEVPATVRDELGADLYDELLAAYRADFGERAVDFYTVLPYVGKNGLISHADAVDLLFPTEAGGNSTIDAELFRQLQARVAE
jgi:energy-coupling factor transporter ATP-binding protein EcfA2